MIHIYDYKNLSGHLAETGAFGYHKADVVVSVDDTNVTSLGLQEFIGKFVRIDTSSGHYYYGLMTKQTPYAVYLCLTPTCNCYHPTRKVSIQKKDVVAVVYQEG